MTRVILACVLVLAMVCLSLWGLYILKTYNDELTRDIDALSATAELGDNKKTAESARQLTEKWVELHHTLCRYVRHTQLDQVTLAMARLEPLALHGEIGELTAELNRCKILLDDIWDSERPLIRNIA